MLPCRPKTNKNVLLMTKIIPQDRKKEDMKDIWVAHRGVIEKSLYYLHDLLNKNLITVTLFVTYFRLSML